MNEMIEIINAEAEHIEAELWGIAINTYGLERTPENMARLEDAARGGVVSKAKGVRAIDVRLAQAISYLAVWTGSKRSDRGAFEFDFLMEAAKLLGALRPYESISQMATRMAEKSHAEHRALAKYAVDYWRDNISPKLSAQKAATELTRVVLLSHKRLAEIVSEEKKKVSRMRTAEPERKA